jgi:hypothetical protein
VSSWRALRLHNRQLKLKKEANEQHEKYERLRFEFTLALINNNDLLHERSFKRDMSIRS